MTKMGYLSHFHWTHAVIAVGLLAASGAGTAVLFKVMHSKEPPICHASWYHICTVYPILAIFNVSNYRMMQNNPFL